MRNAAAYGLAPHSAACLFWYLRNKAFFDQDLGNRTDVMLACYESLVQKSEQKFERLCRHLSIMFEPAVVAEVKEEHFIAPHQRAPTHRLR